MTGPSAVSPTSLNPEWDITLTDGTDSVGVVLTDGQGNRNHRAIQRTPFGNRTAIKTAQGTNKYEDLELPYMTIPQNDWSGGRGKLVFDEDASRYWDGFRCDTSRDNKVILGPLETYSTVPYKYTDGYPILASDQFVWRELSSAPTYYARSFVASDDYDSQAVQLWIKKTGTPGNLMVAIYSDDSGEPDAVVDTAVALAAGSVNAEETYLYRFLWSPTGATISITGSATYHIVVYVATGTHDATNYWSVGFENGVSGNYSIDASLWAAVLTAPFFRVDAEETVTDYGTSNGIYFEYKGALYWASIPGSGKASILYINGDRGAAASNSADKTWLYDATPKTWTVDEWIGSIVEITGGPGAGEWRTITANTATALAVSPDWIVTHTTATEYVIKKSNKWSAVESLTYSVKDIAVANGYVIIANGNQNMQMYRAYNNAGTWTDQLATMGGIWGTKNIHTIQQPDSSWDLYGTYHAYGGNEVWPEEYGIWRAKVSDSFSILEKVYGEVFPTNVPWDSRVISYVTNEVNAGMTYITSTDVFTTGTLAVYEPPDPVDLTQGNSLSFWIKSNETFTAGQLQLKLDDWVDLGQTPSPAKFLAPRRMSPTKVFLYDWSAGTYDTAATFGRLYDGTSNGYTIAGWTTDDWLFVGFSSPFSALYFDMGATVNDETATMNVYYFDGKAFSTLGTNDKTLVSGDTLHQDGLLGFTSIPPRWEPSYVNSVEAYWVALVPSANLTANIVITDINVIAAATSDLTAQAIDPDTSTNALVWPRQYDGIYVGWGDKFNAVYFDMGTSLNSEESSMTAYYYNGHSWTALTISDGTETANDTLAQDGNITFTIPYDWQTYTIGSDDLYWVKFVPVPDTATDELDEVSIADVYVTRQNNITINLPAITADKWTYCILTPTLGFTKYPYPDFTQVKSIALYCAADQNVALSIRLHGGIQLISTTGAAYDHWEIESSIVPNKIVSYISSDGVTVNPFIFTNRGPKEIQTQNNDAIVDLPIAEITALSDDKSGVAVCKNDVYLYFNLGRKIERYYNGNLEDIGPDLDDGMPAIRQGDVVSLLSYPGRVYAAINAGTTSGQYSSILLNKGSGWHEIYRAPSAMPIYAMYYQAIPGSNTGRLWVAQDTDIIWIPISTNPDTDPDYYYFPEGYIITGWIYAGMWAIKKVFDSLTMFIENAYAGQMYAQVEYQVDDSTTTWTSISGDYDTAVEEIALATARPSGRRIRFRIHLQTYNTGNTPVLTATSVDLYGVVPLKYQYTFTGLLSELTHYDVNLDEQEMRALGYADAAETALALLDGWADNATVLTMNSRYSLYNGKTVLMTAPVHQPIDTNPVEQYERHVLNITCHDL